MPVNVKKNGINSATVMTCKRSRMGLCKLAGMIAPTRKAPMMKCNPMRSVASADAIVAAPTITGDRVLIT